jgi:hypothetical protein
VLAHDLCVRDSRHASGSVGLYLGECVLIGSCERLIVLRSIAECRDHRILASLHDVSQRSVGLLIGELVDELMQTLPSSHVGGSNVGVCGGADDINRRTAADRCTEVVLDRAFTRSRLCGHAGGVIAFAASGNVELARGSG